MSRKTGPEDRDRGLLVDAWDYVHLAEASYDIRITCELRAARQKGVWEVYWVAKAEHQNGGFVTVCSYTTSYPSAHHSTLAGAMLRGAIEIDRLAGDWALGLERAVTSDPE